MDRENHNLALSPVKCTELVDHLDKAFREALKPLQVLSIEILDLSTEYFRADRAERERIGSQIRDLHAQLRVRWPTLMELAKDESFRVLGDSLPRTHPDYKRIVDKLVAEHFLPSETMLKARETVTRIDNDLMDNNWQRET